MAIFKFVDVVLDNVAKPVFFGTIFTLYVIYVVTFFGIFYVDKRYVHYLDTFIQTLIALILILRFNPFRSHYVLHKYDVNVIFSSAMFLLTNVGLTEFAYGSMLHDASNAVHSASDTVHSAVNIFA